MPGSLSPTPLFLCIFIPYIAEKMSSAKCLACFNFQGASNSFKVSENIVRVSNILDPGEMPILGVSFGSDVVAYVTTVAIGRQRPYGCFISPTAMPLLYAGSVLYKWMTKVKICFFIKKAWIERDWPNAFHLFQKHPFNCTCVQTFVLKSAIHVQSVDVLCDFVHITDRWRYVYCMLGYKTACLKKSSASYVHVYILAPLFK